MQATSGLGWWSREGKELFQTAVDLFPQDAVTKGTEVCSPVLVTVQ